MEKEYKSGKTDKEIILTDDFYMLYELLTDVLVELKRGNQK